MRDHEPYIAAAEAAVAKKQSEVPTVPLAKPLPADVDRLPAPGTASFDVKRSEAEERRRRENLLRDERAAIRDVDDPDKPAVRDLTVASELKGVMHVSMCKARAYRAWGYAPTHPTDEESDDDA